MKEKKRTNIKCGLLFITLAIILVLIIFGAVKTIGKTLNKPVKENSPLFSVDQILIKTLIKEGESMTRQINIMDVSEEGLISNIEPQYLSDIVSFSDNNFIIKPGQTKAIYVNFDSVIEEKDIKHNPDVYVGSLLVKSEPYMEKRVPVIAEIETKDLLFDTNIDIPLRQKDVEQGDHLEVHVKLFNLKNIGLTNLNMDYFVKDISGNTIITESESITIETQVSFVKVIDIPKKLSPGEYVFAAVARYGSSVGTSSSLFEVISLEEEKSTIISSMVPYLYLGNGVTNNYVLGIIIGLMIIICFMIIAKKMSLFEKLKVKLKRRKIKREETKIVKKELKPEKIIKKKEVSKREKLINLKLSENFKKLAKREKSVILIMILTVVLISLTSVLIELGILSSEQLSVGNVIINIRSVPYTLSDWIRQYYLYIIIGTLVIGAILIYFIERYHKKLMKGEN